MMRNALIPAATILLLAMTAALVSAAPASSVTITSPKNDAVLSGSDVEISVTFASSTQPVTRVQINLDGEAVTERAYDAGITSGECGFLWDTARTPDGQHKLDVQIYSGKKFLGMTTSIVRVENAAKPAEDQASSEPGPDIRPPQVKIESPKAGETVMGKVPVIIQAKDNSGKSPYVSVFVDKSLKAITNHEPYTYTWDSSQAENGPHEIHISAIDDSENRTVSEPVRIIVRNPERADVMTTAVPEKAPDVVPLSSGETLGERARLTTPASESFETPAPLPSLKSATVLAPLTTETEPVLDEVKSEPEVAVLVSGPVEYTFSAPATPAEKPVEVAAARTDEPKKPVTTHMPMPEPTAMEYTVQPGEALWTIARRFDTTVEAIVEANGIEDPNFIKMGRTLQIPGSTATMVSLRTALDQVGGKMDWEAKNRAVHAWAPGTVIHLQIGSPRAEVNAEQVMMERPAALKAGRTMVPQSFVTDTLSLMLAE